MRLATGLLALLCSIAAHAVDFVRYQYRSVVSAEGWFTAPVGGIPHQAACGDWLSTPRIDADPLPEPWRSFRVSSFRVANQASGCPYTEGAPATIGEPTAWPVARGVDDSGNVYVTCSVWGEPSKHALARCWSPTFVAQHVGTDFVLRRRDPNASTIWGNAGSNGTATWRMLPAIQRWQP